MSIRRRKQPREKDPTSRYLSGADEADHDQDDASKQRFSARSKNEQQNRMEQTAVLRAADGADAADLETLPQGRVFQVHSLYSEVISGGVTHLCTIRKTLTKLRETQLVVGDEVKIRLSGKLDESGRPEAVIEQILPRRTILTRSDSFKGTGQHPIVANAHQMLIVASLHLPDVKWGLIDRMMVAAEGGGLKPIICLNKIDTAKSPSDLEEARESLKHYDSLGAITLQTSVETEEGLDALRAILKDKTTVLAGHSGVGKSSLIRAVQSSIDLRIAAISNYTGKGRHTTTSAKIYPLEQGGEVIDTPGVKLFGLWGITRENLAEHFSDVVEDRAPTWRAESYKRIAASL